MKKGIRLLAFFLLLAVLFFAAYRVFSWKDTSGDYLSSMQQLYHTPENTMDVVFVGSSHCYCTLYPALLWERSGIAAFDAATSGQDKDSSYHVLVELLKTQKPKVVGVDLYGLCLDKQGIEGNAYRNMLAMRTSRNSIELIRDYVEPENRMDFYLKWPIIHTRFWELGKYDYVTYEPSIYGRGAVYQWGYGEAEKGECDGDGTAELDQKNQQWLEKLVALSKENHFELFFFIAPFYVTEEGQARFNAAAEFAKENGIALFDFNRMHDEIGLDYKTDYRELYHLNAYGAEKVTEYVRGYLTENYDLPDRRGQAGYEQWDQDLTWYRHLEFQGKLDGGREIGETLDEISKMDQLYVAVDVNASDGPISEEELTYLERLGFQREELADGGCWILQGGEKTKVLDHGEEREFVQDLGAYDSIRIRSGAERTANDVCINYDALLQTDHAVNVIIYDLFLQERLQNLGF